MDEGGRARGRLRLALTLLCSAAAVLLAGGGAHAIAPGEPAPAFDLPGADGQRTTLASLAGEVVVINFWATWCKPCVAELPDLDRLHRREGGPRVVAISVDTETDRAAALVTHLRLGLTVLLDPKSEVVSRYQAPKLPTTYLLDPQGVVRAVYPGALDDAALRDLDARVAALRAERPGTKGSP